MRKRFFSLLVLVSLFLLAGCAGITPTGQGPTATSQGPTPTATATPATVNVYVSTADKSDQNTITALNGATGKPLWSGQIGEGTQNSPVLAQGVVYVFNATSLAAFSAKDGKRLWSYQTPGNGRVLGVVNGVVYGETFAASSSENAAVFALNASDGSVRWNHQTSGFSGGGLLAEGVIYEEVYHQGCSCSNPPSYQLALNASDGSVKWQTPQTNDHFSFQMAASGLLYGLEAGGEGPVANLQVRSASTGSVAWQFPTSPDTAMVDIIGMANGVVYLTSNDGDFSNFPSTPTIIYALNATTGATFWRTPLPGTVPVIATLRDQVVYLGDTDGSALTALNASDGKQLWKTSLGTPGSATNQVITASVVSNGIVYVSLPGGFAALKASDGSVQWKAPASGYASVLAVQGGLVYGSTNNTNTYPNGQNAIYALKASDGSSVWTYAVPAIFSPPVVG